MDGALTKLIKSGYGIEEDYNCTEKIVRGANVAYGLNLPEEALRMMGGFGGGMGQGETCGVVTGAVAVLSSLLVQERAHATPELKPATQLFIQRFQETLDDMDCRELRPKYRTPEHGCDYIITIGAQLLDELIDELNIQSKKTS